MADLKSANGVRAAFSEPYQADEEKKVASNVLRYPLVSTSRIFELARYGFSFSFVSLYLEALKWSYRLSIEDIGESFLAAKLVSPYISL